MRLFASRPFKTPCVPLGARDEKGSCSSTPGLEAKCPVREWFRTGHGMVASIFDRHLQDRFPISLSPARLDLVL